MTQVRDVVGRDAAGVEPGGAERPAGRRPPTAGRRCATGRVRSPGRRRRRLRTRAREDEPCPASCRAPRRANTAGSTCSGRGLPVHGYSGPSERSPVRRTDHRRRLWRQGRRPAGGPAADLRRHQPPRRRQVHADRGAGPARPGDRPGRRRARQGRPPGHRVGLDGHGARPRHLHHLGGAAVRVPRRRHQPAGHPGPRGLLRGHLPGAHRRRRRGDADRRRQGPRGPDDEAVRGLPAPRHPGASPSSTSGTARARTPWS